MCIYVCMHIYVCVCLCVYMYITHVCINIYIFYKDTECSNKLVSKNILVVYVQVTLDILNKTTTC